MLPGGILLRAASSLLQKRSVVSSNLLLRRRFRTSPSCTENRSKLNSVEAKVRSSLYIGRRSPPNRQMFATKLYWFRLRRCQRSWQTKRLRFAAQALPQNLALEKPYGSFCARKCPCCTCLGRRFKPNSVAAVEQCIAPPVWLQDRLLRIRALRLSPRSGSLPCRCHAFGQSSVE